MNQSAGLADLTELLLVKDSDNVPFDTQNSLFLEFFKDPDGAFLGHT